MTQKPIYCIDTNFIIQGRKYRFPPEQFPGLWANIEALIAGRRMYASSEVRTELDVVEDELKRWATSQSGLFVPLDQAQTNEVTRIQTDFENLVDYRANKSGADPFVIALAKVHGYTIVTQERMSGPGERPRIPNVCQHYDIPYVDIIGLMKLEGWRF